MNIPKLAYTYLGSQSLRSSLHKCLACYKPMAPLHYQNTTYLVKLWYFKGKGSVDQIDLLFQKT